MKNKTIVIKIMEMLSRRQKLSFLFILLIMIISALLSQLVPLAIGTLTDEVLNTSAISFTSIIPFLLFILVVTVINEILKVARRLLVEDTATRTEKLARSKAVESLLLAPLSYFKENMTGHIHGKLNRSLEGTIRLIKLMFMDFAPAIFTSIAAIIVIFTKLPFILAITMILVVPIGIFIVFRQISTQKGIRVQLLDTKSSMDGTMVELINGIEVIRITDNVTFEMDRFDKNSEYLRSKEMKHHKAMAFYDCLKFINEAIFTVLILGFSVYLASKGTISVGSVLTAYLCFMQLTTPLKELHRIFDELSESIILAKEYFKITDIPKDFSYEEVTKQDTKIKTTSFIEIKKLSFQYDLDSKDVIIDNLNLNIQKGEFLGIVGPSGCGKSSFIKAISKLEKATGSIIIDQKNIDSYSRKDIASIISLVPQQPFLIAGTILENICYGLSEEPSFKKVEEAARRANIHDYIQSLPDGYHSLIAEGGSNLSGGQRQRIAIARIFLRTPKILILDEATSALDNTSEKYIQKEIEKLKQQNNTTILSIAHRLSTLKNCDHIIVLNRGKVEQVGTFDSLKDESGIFSDMYHGTLK